MRLIGKRVERQNKFGDDYCIEFLENGKLKLSPALISSLGITATSNRIGFAYPDKEGEKLYIYKCPDKDGVAVNKQGYVVNLPHWRDLKSHFNIVEDGKKLYISSQETLLDEFIDYSFYEVSQGKDSLNIDEERGWKYVDRAEPVTEDETYSEQEAKIQEELPSHSTDQYDEEKIPEAVVQEQEDEVQEAYYNIEQGKVQKNIVNNEVEHIEAPEKEPTGDSMDIF